MTSTAPPGNLPSNVPSSATTGALKFRDMILSKFAQSHANLTNNLDKNSSTVANMIMSQSEPKITEDSAQWVLLLPLYYWFHNRLFSKQSQVSSYLQCMYFLFSPSLLCESALLVKEKSFITFV